MITFTYALRHMRHSHTLTDASARKRVTHSHYTQLRPLGFFSSVPPISTTHTPHTPHTYRTQMYTTLLPERAHFATTTTKKHSARVCTRRNCTHTHTLAAYTNTLHHTHTNKHKHRNEEALRLRFVTASTATTRHRRFPTGGGGARRRATHDEKQNRQRNFVSLRCGLACCTACCYCVVVCVCVCFRSFFHCVTRAPDDFTY